MSVGAGHEAPGHGGAAAPAQATALRGVIADLVELARNLPVPSGETEVPARVLDRLAEESTEAAEDRRLSGGRKRSEATIR